MSALRILDCHRPTKARLLELFDFDEVEGRLFWKDPPAVHRRLLGKEAGSPRGSHSGKVYWHVKIGRIPFKRSHLVYCLVTGGYPPELIDHIDGNSLNDKPHNLRAASALQNAWNHKRRAKRSPLPMGVRAMGRAKKYQARIGYKKRLICLGVFETIEEASAVYLAKRLELFREFA